MTEQARERRTLAAKVLAIAALVVFFVVILVVIAVLAFSVTVAGSSMEPTVRPGDRLLMDPVGSGDLARFDLLESTLGDREIPVVKRVVGLPGDRVAVRVVHGDPQVLVRPAGEQATYVVENPTWPGQYGAKVAACCRDDGTTLLTGATKPSFATVPAGGYWVIGDNWGGSDDSRTFGFVQQAQVRARLWFRVWPASRFGALHSDARLVPLR